MGSNNLVPIGSQGEQEGNRRNKTELPHDLVLEILVKLPVKSLTRFKCVCKLWYNIIISHDFIAMHREANLKKPLFAYGDLYRSNTGPPITSTISFRFNDVLKELTLPFDKAQRLTILGCVEGLVLLSLSDLEQKFVLWNPATEQIRQIGSKVNWGFSGVFFDFKTNTCMVASLVFFTRLPKKSVAQVSIHKLNDDSRRDTEINVPFGISAVCGEYICLKRCMYWIIWSDRSYGSRYILCFDMVDESFKQIAMPPHEWEDSHFAGLYIYKESPAMFVRYSGRIGTGPCPDESCWFFDVWVLNDCGSANQSWIKIFTLNPSTNYRQGFGFFTEDGVDWIVLKEGEDCMLCNPGTGQTKRISAKLKEFGFFSYSESLVSSSIISSKIPSSSF